jgi:DNA segregation ATPase FtsK/SpoIIIE, S-DNA-T family
MARRRRRRKELIDYIRLPKVNLDLDSETKRGIFILFLFAFGAVSALALFDLAGLLGTHLNSGLTYLFGVGKWLVPVVVLALSFLLFNEDKYEVRRSNYLGLFLFLISFPALLFFFIPLVEWEEAALSGAGGGRIGFWINGFFIRYLGYWASLIIVFCLFVASFHLMFKIPLVKLVGRENPAIVMAVWLFSLLKRLLSRPENEDEENEKEKETEEPEEEKGEEEEEDVEDTGEEEEDQEEEKEEEKEAPEFFKSHGLKEEAEEPRKKNGKTSSWWEPTNLKIDIPLELLSGKINKPSSGDIKIDSETIIKKLRDFNIGAEMKEVKVGPTVTQYSLKPDDDIKVAKITTLSNDLALALAKHPIRIEAPIPNKSLVGVEVPNQTKATVGLREVFRSQEYKEKKSKLTIALGKDVAGKSWVDNLAKMPHLLVAGATLSGKSVSLHAIIMSLLFQNNPDDLRFIMVDPKRVELTKYNGIPHLLTPVITDVNRTINALKWCLNEMDRRLALLEEWNKQDIEGFNAINKKEAGRLPYIVFVIDELADLMLVASRDIEAGITRLTQMARAVGIHLILATQRPSVNIITGVIKANMPSRIAFSVVSGIDSRTILDSLGAEKLLGRGDMLYTSQSLTKPRRMQGAYVSEDEIKRIVRYIKNEGGSPEFIKEVTEDQKVRGFIGMGFGGTNNGQDDLLIEAKEVVIEHQKASASFLQRKLRIGYARAASILDELEKEGVVGAGNGAKPREILISPEDYGRLKAMGVSGVPLHRSQSEEVPDESEEEDDENEGNEEESDDEGDENNKGDEENDDSEGAEEGEENDDEEGDEEESSSAEATADEEDDEDEEDVDNGKADEDNDETTDANEEEDEQEEQEEESGEDEDGEEPPKLEKEDKNRRTIVNKDDLNKFFSR